MSNHHPFGCVPSSPRIIRHDEFYPVAAGHVSLEVVMDGFVAYNIREGFCSFGPDLIDVCARMLEKGILDYYIGRVTEGGVEILVEQICHDYD